jgi:hypothetical protein
MTPERTTSYSQAEAVRFTPATTSNMKWWTSKGIIRADVAEAAGTGHHRRFSLLNLVEAAVAVELNRYYMPVDAIRGALAVLRFLDANGRVQPASTELEAFTNWRDEITARVNGSQQLRAEGARVLGSKTADELIANLLMWRLAIDARFRGKLAFAGITFSASRHLYGFFAQPKGEQLWFPVDKFGPSILFVNILPILSDLEAATGDSLK